MLRLLISLSIITCSLKIHAYYVTGGLLYHVNLVKQNSDNITFDIVNDEKEDNIFNIEYGTIEISQDGVVTLNKNDNQSLPIVGPSTSLPVPAGDKQTITIEIKKQNPNSHANYLSLGVLVSKVSKDMQVESHGQVTTAFKIVQNYLIQVYAQLKRPEIGQIEIDKAKLNGQFLEFELTNHSKELAESEVFVFLKKENKSLGEPLKRKTRILADHTRTLKFELNDNDVTSAVVFIDDPNFELAQKEFNLK